MRQLPPHASTVLDAAADAAGIERALVRAVAWVESRGNPRAVSRAGAMGLLQLMPRTAHGMGLLSDAELRQVQAALEEGGPPAVALLDLATFDPQQNAAAGARMLARLIEHSGGRIDEALARYNWGTGNVTRRGGWPSSVQSRYIDPVLQRLALERAEQPELAERDTVVTQPKQEGDGEAERPFAGGDMARALCSASLPCPCCGSYLLIHVGVAGVER